MKKFLIRLRNWEYWPFSLVYFPVFFYYGWLSLKHRSFFFFTSSNPRIEFGGMFGERKSDIFKQIPQKYIPTSHLISRNDFDDALQCAREVGFPLIAKPDIGERGRWVKILHTEDELKMYSEDCPVDFLLQEMVNYPIELGVFYARYPNELHGQITSIVRKDFLTVVGDGNTTIMELVLRLPRALVTANLESDYLVFEGDKVLEKGQLAMIEPIGNHSRGTKFMNDNDKIDDQLTGAIDRLSKQIPDFYFGRFDLKCSSYEDLKQLKHFKILELNGAGSEPGHIYQPGYSLFQAYKDILWHLRLLADISEQNRKRGIPFWTFKKGFKKWMAHRRYNRLLTS